MASKCFVLILQDLISGKMKLENPLYLRTMTNHFGPISKYSLIYTKSTNYVLIKYS